MKNTFINKPGSAFETIKVDGTFISSGRFALPQGGSRSKVCLLVKLPKALAPQLIFVDGSAVENQIGQFGNGNRHKVHLVLSRTPGLKLEQISPKQSSKKTLAA